MSQRRVTVSVMSTETIVLVISIILALAGAIGLAFFRWLELRLAPWRVFKLED